MTTRTPLAPDGVIFDLDDTLLDNEYDHLGAGLHERIRFEVIKEVGIERGIQPLQEATILQSITAFQTAKVTSFEYALWNLFCIVGIRHNPDSPDSTDELMIEVTERKNARYSQILSTTIKEVPGSTEFVRHMAKITNGRLAIGSSARRVDIDSYLKTKSLTELFNGNITSIESVVHAKPHPEVFLLALKSLEVDGIQLKNVCVFEDDPKGIMAAKAAGLFACAITTRYSREQFETLNVAPDIIANTYDEMITHFKVV